MRLAAIWAVLAAVLLAAPVRAQTSDTCHWSSDVATACSATGPYRSWYDAPTTRYAHGVLGDAVEWGGLVVDGPTGTSRVDLPTTRVFEDIAPRLADLDADGIPEVVVVETEASSGAQLAIYRLDGARLVKDAATPHIGSPNRWLAPFAITDLNGDGAMDIAYIDRPHLAKTLRVWTYRTGKLVELIAARGLTNHRIGEDFISGGVRDCGAGPQLVTANAGWTDVVGTRWTDGTLVFERLGPFTGPQSLKSALICP